MSRSPVTRPRPSRPVVSMASVAACLTGLSALVAPAASAHTHDATTLSGLVADHVVCQGDVRPDDTVGRLPLFGTRATEAEATVTRDGGTAVVRPAGPLAVLGVAVVSPDGSAVVRTVGSPERGAAVTVEAGDEDAVVPCVSERPELADHHCALTPTDLAVTLTDATGTLRRAVHYRAAGTWSPAAPLADPAGPPVLWNRWTSDDDAVTPLTRAEVSLLDDVVAGPRCGITLTLASYATQGPTWPTSGEQTFLDADRTRLRAHRRSDVLTVQAPSGDGQVDLYRGRTVFDGGHGAWHGPTPHYPDVLTPGNGALVSAWNGGPAA